MKKEIVRLCIIFSWISLFNCSDDDTFKGSGNIISQNRNVANFTQVDNATSINVVITEGSSQEVQVSADDNVINEINTTVENDVLKIDLSKGNYTDVTITVSVTIPNLESLENTGSGNMTISGFEDLSNLSIDNEGSGSIMINGSGTVLLLKNSGSGSYEGFGFTVANCTVNNTGSGNCEINCTQTLSGSNSGSGSVFYKGSADIDINNTGSGQVVDSN